MTSIGALPAAVAVPVSSSATAVAATPAAPAAPAALAQAEDAVRIGSVPLDLAAFAAIMGSIDPSGSAGATHDNAAFQDAMTMIGGTLAQRQGGYFLAIDAPGGGLMTSMTPGQLSAYMQSGGTLYNDTVVSSDGHTYSLYDLLKQAFAASRRQELLQAANPLLDDPCLEVAEGLLDQMRADSAPADSQRSLLFGSRTSGSAAARHIQTLVLQMGAAGSAGVGLSVVYFPSNPTAGSPAPPAAAPVTLRLTA